MTERNLILYAPGCYGHFIYWCMHYFTTDQPMPVPFDDAGRCHNIDRTGFIDKEYYNKIHDLPEQHLWFTHYHNIDINQVAKDFDTIIGLHGTNETLLWMANNDLCKTTVNATHETSYDPSTMLKVENWERLRIWCKRWLENFDNDLSDWQLRENFSYWNIEQLPGFQSIRTQECALDYVTPVNIAQLKNNFESVIKSIIALLNMSVKKNNFDDIYHAWFSKQSHHDKDNLIGMIVESVTSTNNFALDNLTCLDEIVIQHKLRTKGYEIKCNGLNTFPTTMQQLRDIIV